MKAKASKESTKFDWIPWQRHVFILNVDGKDMLVGRFRRREKIQREADRYGSLKGIEPRIVDTKEGK